MGSFVTGLFQKIQEQTKALVFVFFLVDEHTGFKYFNVIYGWGLFKVFLFLFQLYVEAKEVGRTHAPLPRPVIGSGVNATIGWKANKPKDSVVHDLIDGSGSVGVRHVSPFVVIGADFDRSVYNRLGRVYITNG